MENLKDTIANYEDIVQYIYKLRCSAEGKTIYELSKENEENKRSLYYYGNRRIFL